MRKGEKAYNFRIISQWRNFFILHSCCVKQYTCRIKLLLALVDMFVYIFFFFFEFYYFLWFAHLSAEQNTFGGKVTNFRWTINVALFTDRFYLFNEIFVLKGRFMKKIRLQYTSVYSSKNNKYITLLNNKKFYKISELGKKHLKM